MFSIVAIVVIVVIAVIVIIVVIVVIFVSRTCGVACIVFFMNRVGTGVRTDDEGFYSLRHCGSKG